MGDQPAVSSGDHGHALLHPQSKLMKIGSDSIGSQSLSVEGRSPIASNQGPPAVIASQTPSNLASLQQHQQRDMSNMISELKRQIDENAAAERQKLRELQERNVTNFREQHDRYIRETN